MKRNQLAHVLRAAAEISGEKSFVLVGSQAVLLLLDEPDARLTLSEEIDLYPALAPDKADAIDGAIGALSRFHDEFGYHADGVSPDTAVMPVDWMTRASLHYFGDVTAICPDLHDLCVSKCVAGREKDAEFVEALFEQGHLNIDTLVARIHGLDANRYPLAPIEAWARRRQSDALKQGNS
jgi:hypothetical protein